MVVPPRDVDDLAGSIVTLAGNSHLTDMVRKRARETALKYDWPEIAAATAKIYVEVLEGAQCAS